MEGYILNPDKEYVKKILEGINKKQGHCPCKVVSDETTLCPCEDFRKTGECKCKLYVKNDNKKTK